MRQRKECFRPGSNRRPCACEAHVITTTLRKLTLEGGVSLRDRRDGALSTWHKASLHLMGKGESNLKLEREHCFPSSSKFSAPVQLDLFEKLLFIPNGAFMNRAITPTSKPPSTSKWSSGATDNASDYGSEDCRFESCLDRIIFCAVRGRKNAGPKIIFALTRTQKMQKKKN